MATHDSTHEGAQGDEGFRRFLATAIASLVEHADGDGLDVGLPRETVRAVAANDEPTLALHHVASNSMEPTLCAGDYVEVDTAKNRAHCDGLWLIAVGEGGPSVRRLQILPGRVARLWCDRSPHLVDLVKLDALCVLGRITRHITVRPVT